MKLGEIEIRANVRMGELLAVAEKQHGARDGKRSSGTEPRSDAPPTLASLGITKKQSHIAQLAASVPESVREKIIEEAQRVRTPLKAALGKSALS